MEAAGFDRGVEALVAAILIMSVAIGALIAQCIINRSSDDQENKQARKAIANAFNGESSTNAHGLIKTNDNAQTNSIEDDMFDVPLNNDRSYVGPDQAVDYDSLTSMTRYSKVASKSGQKQSPVGGPLVEDEEYSFDVSI